MSILIVEHVSHDFGGFYTIDVKIKEVATGLGLHKIGLDKPVSDLSGGQRSKVLLTKLLLENPMILILDEPTNYLDEHHIHWLVNFLSNYENAFILVSHDVDFLNKVVNVIYHLNDGQLTRYKGDYKYYLTQVELKKRQKDATIMYKAFSRVQRNLQEVCIFQSDRGNKFKNRVIEEVLETFDITRSLSAKGTPLDNAVAKAAYKVIKTEFAGNRIFNSFEELEVELFDYVNGYNNIPIHGTLGYVTPVAYRQSVL